jgi:hypothetical protein
VAQNLAPNFSFKHGRRQSREPTGWYKRGTIGYRTSSYPIEALRAAEEKFRK